MFLWITYYLFWLLRYTGSNVKRINVNVESNGVLYNSIEIILLRNNSSV